MEHRDDSGGNSGSMQGTHILYMDILNETKMRMIVLKNGGRCGGETFQVTVATLTVICIEKAW